jgi:hypothetical protein
VRSFVCSIGSVPLAAALHDGGIGFGGVVFLALAALLLLRFVRTGGREMLTMMGGSPDDPDHHAHHLHEDHAPRHHGEGHHG